MSKLQQSRSIDPAAGISLLDLTPSNLEAHLPELLELVSCWPLATWERSNFELDLMGKWECSFVAKDGTRTIGVCIASEKSTYELYIHLFYLRPEYRSRKLGALMLHDLMSRGERRGRQYVRLRCPVTNTPAVAFYERQGFEIVAQLDDQVSGDTPDFLMERTLSSPNYQHHVRH